MNISQALKEKNRLVGKINKEKDIFTRENSRRSDNVSAINRHECYSKILKLKTNLVNLKTAINIASSPIARKLVEIAELKSFISFLNELYPREGEERIAVTREEYVTYTWNSFLNRQEIEKIIEDTEFQINYLQDEIDKFNALTDVDFTEGQ